jgi:hypothetical protein
MDLYTGIITYCEKVAVPMQDFHDTRIDGKLKVWLGDVGVGYHMNVIDMCTLNDSYNFDVDLCTIGCIDYNPMMHANAYDHMYVLHKDKSLVDCMKLIGLNVNNIDGVAYIKV